MALKTIRIPKTPRTAFNKKRPVSNLLKAQIAHLEAAAYPAGTAPKRPRRPRNEGQASAYIAELTRQLHPAGAQESAAPPAVAPLPWPAATPPVVTLAIPAITPGPLPTAPRQPVRRRRKRTGGAANAAATKRTPKRGPARSRSATKSGRRRPATKRSRAGIGAKARRRAGKK